MSTTVKNTRKVATFSLATMQEITSISESVQTTLSAWNQHNLTDRTACGVELHYTTLESLSPVARKRVEAISDRMETAKVERVAITRTMYATLNRNGKGGHIYRGSIEGGKREHIGAFRSREELDAWTASVTK